MSYERFILMISDDSILAIVNSEKHDEAWYPVMGDRLDPLALNPRIRT